MSFEVRELNEGDIVEFDEHYGSARFGVVFGGNGMSPKSIGSAIFAHFGSTADEAIQHARADTLKGIARDAYMAEFHSMHLFDPRFGTKYTNRTERQKTRIVGHIEIDKLKDDLSLKQQAEQYIALLKSNGEWVAS